MCGEHTLALLRLFSDWGSSPRVRGTPPFRLSCPTLTGIIPACAGNTRVRRWPTTRRRDHPRVCGEHEALLTPQFADQGSSPRVRGTPGSPAPRCPGAGIIPACAGNTPTPVRNPVRTGDHPRVCGEHEAAQYRVRIIEGSSPRVRGTRDAVVGAEVDRGIIPACAGNTSVSLRRRAQSWDHPRVCGEHNNGFDCVFLG